jgi:hypothetical protein
MTDIEPCGCCRDWSRWVGSGQPPCPTCGHTVEDCEPNYTEE